MSKDNSNSSGTHIVWDAANPTKITVQQFENAHEYLTLNLKVNNLEFSLENGIPYIVERHANSDSGADTNNFSTVVTPGICFDLTGGINGYITVTIPSGKTTINNRVYYYNGVTFTITGE